MLLTQLSNHICLILCFLFHHIAFQQDEESTTRINSNSLTPQYEGVLASPGYPLSPEFHHSRYAEIREMPASSHVTFTLLSDAALIASYSQLGVKTGAASSWSYFNKTLSSPVSAVPNEDGEVDIYIIAGVDNFQPAFLLKFQGLSSRKFIRNDMSCRLACNR